VSISPLRVSVLAGGIGAARFLGGLVDHLARGVPDAELTVVGNTADDMQLFGLHISPDLDTVMYTLGGGIHPDQGWGREDETFQAQNELAAYGVEPQWFSLGDRDLATHIVRTQMLAAYPLSDVTAALCRRWFAELPVPVRLLPMTDDRVETHVVVDDPDSGRRAMHFQEWWVRLRAGLPAQQIALVGVDQARPAPGVLEAIAKADAVLLAPSNPVVSIGPILSVPGVRDALRQATAPVVGLSPIIGGRPVRGMADACLTAIGVETSAAAVAGMFADVLDGWLVDTVDADLVDAIAAGGVTARAVPLLMSDAAATEAMARQALALADELR
jgi:LPPG:FO 2-phospho-L-lactate transferase